jgi:hypothetical protein
MITDKNKVEVALRRAQLAVLNPGVGFAEILEMDEEQLRKGIPNHEPLLFSRNVVCVDLEGTIIFIAYRSSLIALPGPDLTDLYFLDLPGMALLISSLPQLNHSLRNYSKRRTSYRPVG